MTPGLVETADVVVECVTSLSEDTYAYKLLELAEADVKSTLNGSFDGGTVDWPVVYHSFSMSKDKVQY